MNALKTLLQPLTARVTSFQWNRAQASEASPSAAPRTTQPVEFWGTADHQARAKRAARWTRQPSTAGSGYVAYAVLSEGRPAHELLLTSTELNPRPLGRSWQ